MDRNTFLELIPAYALGALDADERNEFEALLSADPEAQRLLAEYDAVVEAMTLITPAMPAPAHLQSDLRKRLSQSSAPATQPSREQPQKSRILVLWRPLAAVAAIVLVLGAVLFLSAQQVSAPNDVGAQMFAEISAQSNARRIALAPSEGQDELFGEMVTTSDGSQAVIEVWQLPSLESDKTFELWLVDENGANSGGTFESENPAGPTYIVVPLDRPLDEFQGVGVSIEPAGGSPEQGPTGSRVFGVSVQDA